MKFIALPAILLKLSATYSTANAAFLVPTARNFGVASKQTNLRNKILKVTIEEEAVDYDAPLERLMAVGDIVLSGDPTLLDHEIIVDDECYAGKDADFKECVDFDPLHGNGIVSKQGHSNESTDFDAPLYRAKAAGHIVSAGDPTLLDHEIVVDDEPTVDFDPLHGNGVVSKNGHSNELTDFDAPLYKAKAAGNIVSAGDPTLLDHEIIVDDECYAGKDADFKQCVDFDPLHGNGIVSKQGHSNESTDFDAPLYRAKAAGHIVSAGDPTLLDHEIVVDDEPTVDFDPFHGNGVVSKNGHSNELTDFDAPLYKAKAAGNIVSAGDPTLLDHEIIVDDECYVGKDADFKECIDFDPLHGNGIVSKQGHSNESTDFDAPLYKAKAAGHIVSAGDPTLLDHEIVVDDEPTVDFDPLHGNGVVSKNGHSNELTDFDAPLYKAKAAGNIVSAGDPILLDHEIIVDDECYAGKDADFKECVDFDPLHGNGVVSKNGHSNELTDFDAPLYKAKAAGHIVSAGDPILLDHEIIVDDECYAGKDADFKECVDFDPLHGNGVVSKQGHSNESTDFDAPLYRAKAAGNIVSAGEPTLLDHEIVVDDECYMGKDSTMTQCVDFDPLHP